MLTGISRALLRLADFLEGLGRAGQFLVSSADLLMEPPGGRGPVGRLGLCPSNEQDGHVSICVRLRAALLTSPPKNVPRRLSGRRRVMEWERSSLRTTTRPQQDVEVDELVAILELPGPRVNPPPSDLVRV